MRSVSLLGAAIWLALVGSAAAQTGYAAVVNRDDAEVRAGPSEDPRLYVTNRLKRGTSIQVIEELGNGWLKIRPPAGSFSWIDTRYVQQRFPTVPTNWVVVAGDSRVAAVVGTDFQKDVPSQIEGSRLATGTQVTSLGPARVDDQGMWLPIEPPPGECRYVRADAVTRGDGSVPAGPTPIAGATSAAKVSGSTPVSPGATMTEAEALGTRAAQAERAGNVAVAIDLYTRAAAAAQATNPELARQASNRAYWLAHPPPYSTFTPAPPTVQLAGPVGVYTTTPSPQSLPAVSSGPGRLRRAGRMLEGRATYVLESAQGRPLFYVTAEAGLELEPYVNRNVELFGVSNYSGELRANCMRAERVQAR
jgi:hypothetical protein